MGQLSEIIADRFCLSLSPQWRRWFDHDAHLPGIPGRFRFPVDVRDLVHPQSQLIWSGLMLPDTLPLIGNGYGDWLCARITDRDELGELIHWYHGGGDWIPVGRTVAEALLHDAIDRYRPLRRQMLRGAAESIRSSGESRPEADYSSSPHGWLHLNADNSTSSIAHNLAELLQVAGDGGYRHALETLIAAGIAAEASTCDLIELLIHQELPDERDLPPSCGPRHGNRLPRLANASTWRQDLGGVFRCSVGTSFSAGNSPMRCTPISAVAWHPPSPISRSGCDCTVSIGDTASSMWPNWLSFTKRFRSTFKKMSTCG